MLEQLTPSYASQRRSLSLRLALLLVLVATIPLAIVMLCSGLLAYSNLLAHSTNEMETDAQTHAELIDDYFSARFMEVAALSTSSAAQGFLSSRANSPDRAQFKTAIVNEMETDLLLDSNYANWSVWDLQGNLAYAYSALPETSNPPWLQGEDREQMIRDGVGMISTISLADNADTVTISMPVISNTARPLGFICATLKLHYVWNVVNSELGTNGSGSYAFVLDQNGVRLADTDGARLLTAIAPLPQNGQDSSGYGKTIPVLADKALADVQESANPPTTFQATPYGQSEMFQVVRTPFRQVPWTYFVLSPLSTITLVANQQLFTSSLIALLVLLAAALTGLWVGRRLARPILHAVARLYRNSQTLHALATKQQNVVNEQSWIVQSSEVGLRAMQQQTTGLSAVAHRINENIVLLSMAWHRFDKERSEQALEYLKHSALAIEQMARSQKAANQRLAIALRVAGQVTDQLASGAASASEAAEQLEAVVDQLRLVVGQ